MKKTMTPAASPQSYQKKVLLFNLVFFAVVGAFFVCTKHFAPDDYGMVSSMKATGLGVMQDNMRLILGCFYLLFDVLSINAVEHQVLLGWLMLLAFALCTTRITIEVISIVGVQDRKEVLALINTGTLLLFGNAFVSEWFWFAEAYIQWILAAVGIMLGALCMGKERLSIVHYIGGFAGTLLCVSSYQSALIAYAFLVMALLFLRNGGKLGRNAIKQIVIAAAMPAVAMIVNTLLHSVFFPGGSRADFSIGAVGSVLSVFFGRQSDIYVHGMGMIPTGIMLFVLVVLLAVLGVTIYKKVTWSTVMFLILILISGQAVLVLSQIMQGHYYVAARVAMFVFAMYTAIIWILAYYFCIGRQNKSLREKTRWCLVLCCGFLLLNAVEIQLCAIDAKRTNEADKKDAIAIHEQVKAYEEKTGIVIQNIGFAPDAASQYRHYSLLLRSTYRSEFAAKAQATIWSDAASYNYLTGSNLTRIEVPDYVKAQFAANNWGWRDLEEQLVFDNNSIYVCVY